jgi:uncharacterized SAM-binding protein YcdF (DUF218 family)
MHIAMTMEYDAAIVLGAALTSDGSPSPALFRRMETAIRMVREGRCGYLLLAGGIVRHPRTEASMMAEMALAAGLPQQVLVLEDRSRNTLENARFCRSIIVERGWRRLALVTEAYHMRRALFTFRRFGISAEGVAARSSGSALWRAGAAFREAVAILVYRWRLRKL